ncbi:MAG: hypothetical protein ACPGUX_05980 [Halocynthiibacter sp.]
MIAILALGLAVIAAPAGFLISAGVAAFQTQGWRRRLSILFLTLTALTVLFFVLIEGRYYFGFSGADVFDGWDWKMYRLFEFFSAACGAGAALCIYLAHTHWPVTSRLVNLPATIGMVLSVAGFIIYAGAEVLPKIFNGADMTYLHEATETFENSVITAV